QAPRRAACGVRVPQSRRSPPRSRADRACLRALSPGASAAERGRGAPVISRRRFLGGLAAGGAAAALGPARGARAQSAEWASVVATARKEAKVVVNTFPGDGYKRALKGFSAAHPDVKVEHTSLH